MKSSILLVVLIGILAGLIGALCGVGGGIVMVPAFVKILGFDPKRAVATSLAVIVINATVATINNQRAAGSLIDWKTVAIVGLGVALAAWFGSDLMRSMSNSTLTRMFGVVLLLIGTQMLWKG